jgi:hypothetical protein
MLATTIKLTAVNVIVVRWLRPEIDIPERLPTGSLHSHQSAGKIWRSEELTRRGPLACKNAARGFQLGRGGVETPDHRVILRFQRNALSPDSRTKLFAVGARPVHSEQIFKLDIVGTRLNAP